jgi:single-stranded-DNA-specific exonuclease
VQAAKVRELKERLEALAQEWLGEQGSGRKVEPEALLPLSRIDRDFMMQLKRLEPFGIGHGAPIFWSRHCQISSCRLLRGGHLELQLAQGAHKLRAMAWRWQGSGLPAGSVDVAFRLRMDRWQGEERLQLEVLGLRPSSGDTVVLMRRQRCYWCQKEGDGVLIRNDAGEEIRWQNHERIDATQANGEGRDIIASHPYLQALFRDAAVALGLTA